MQTTLLGLAIAFIIALVAALVGPHFIDWNQFRPQFEAEAAKVIGAPVRVEGALDARLLPTPTLRLASVTVGGPNDLGKFRADKLDVEFSLGDLMRGDWRANELTIGGLALDLGLDGQGKVDLPAMKGQFNLGALSIDRLNLTGRIALHDAASRKTLELNDIAFSGDVRSLAGSVRGDGSFAAGGIRYPFRVSSGQTGDGNGTRVHLAIDPGEQPVSADLDGVLTFEARAPHFEGSLTFASPPKAKASDGSPWRIAAKVKADHAMALLEQIDASYGLDERALKFAGIGDVRFGASPVLHATLSARQLDADRFLSRDNKDSAKDDAKDNAKDNAAAPVQLLPNLRSLAAALPHPPIAMQIEVGAEQIMLGGRPLQNLVADLHSDTASWAIDRLDLRAPGATHVAFNGTGALTGPSGNFSGALDVDCTDPDMLMTWLQGRGDTAYRNQKPFRLRGDVNVTADRVAIERLKAEIDGGAVEGRMALVTGSSPRVEAALKAERLDLDAATSFVRSMAGQKTDWPGEANVSLDIGHALTSGRDLHPFTAKFSYDPKTVSLEQLRFAEAGGVTTEASGSFNRVEAAGKLALSADAGQLSQITALITPLAPALASRLSAFAGQRGPARVKLVLDLGRNSGAPDRANARAVVDLSAPQLSGSATITAKPQLAAIRALDRDAIAHTEFGIETKLASQRANAMLALLGLDQAIAVGEGTAQFEGSVSGAWRAPLRVSLKMWGPGVDAEAQGMAEPWAEAAKASLDLKIRSVNLAPLFGLKPADTFAKDIRLFGRATLAGNRLSLDDIDSIVARSRLRGHLALTLDAPRQVDGEIGLDALDLAPAFALAIGSEGRDTADPLGVGLMKGWRGKVAFQALGGTLPGGIELRPISGVVRSDGQSLTLDSIKGKIAGGEATANIDARQDPNGISLIGHLDVTGADGTLLHYRGLKMPAGRISLQVTLSSQGRSASALSGALSGGGIVKLESGSIAGLDPRAMDVAIRASDQGQVGDDARLRQIVEPVLSAGALPVALAEIPFTVQDGRLHVDPVTLEAQGARAKISGGYDIPADQTDIRVTLTSTTQGAEGARPEIQLFTVGSPDTLNRSVDVAPLSRWLALRAIDRETRRLDSLERGGPQPQPTSVPPSTAALPQTSAPATTLSQPQVLPVAPPPRQPPPRAVAPPRPPATAPAAPAPPVVSQQVAPLPSPIEVRPAPAPLPPKPRPKPPMVLVPPPGSQ